MGVIGAIRSFHPERVRFWGLLIAAAAFWILVLRPDSWGGPASYIVVSGDSMQPTYQQGDLVFALDRPSYGVGDVIVYPIPAGEVGAGKLIVHRIQAQADDQRLIVKGDNREVSDIWRPTPESVTGKVLLHVPSLGSLLIALRAPFGWALFAGVVTYFVLTTLIREDPPATVDRSSGESPDPSNRQPVRVALIEGLDRVAGNIRRALIPRPRFTRSGPPPN